MTSYESQQRNRSYKERSRNSRVEKKNYQNEKVTKVALQQISDDRRISECEDKWKISILKYSIMKNGQNIRDMWNNITFTNIHAVQWESQERRGKRRKKK